MTTLTTMPAVPTPRRAASPLTAIEIASRRRAQWLWPMIIVGLLLMNVTIVIVTVILAAGDPSAAVEPDYYAKALAFDSTMKQREASAKLGWTAEPSLRTAADGRTPELVVRLNDRDHQALSGAAVTITAFPSVRSGERQSLSATAAQPGVYITPIRITRGGIWIIRIVARVGDDVLETQTDLIVPLMNP